MAGVVHNGAVAHPIGLLPAVEWFSTGAAAAALVLLGALLRQPRHTTTATVPPEARPARRSISHGDNAAGAASPPAAR